MTRTVHEFSVGCIKGNSIEYQLSIVVQKNKRRSFLLKFLSKVHDNTVQVMCN